MHLRRRMVTGIANLWKRLRLSLRRDRRSVTVGRGGTKRAGVVGATRARGRQARAEARGEQGENRVFAVVDEWSRRRPAACVHIYRGLRLPRVAGTRKFELDLVLVGTGGIVALEVKNWHGELESSPDGDWRRTVGGALEAHGNPLARLKVKLDALHHYVQRVNDVSIPRDAVCGRVVLADPTCRQGARLAASRDVVSLADLAGVLDTLLGLESPGLRAAARRLVRRASPPRQRLDDIPAVVRALDRLPTWDVVYLRGGRVMKGDFVCPVLTLGGSSRLRRRTAREMRFEPATDGCPAAVTWTGWAGDTQDATLDDTQQLRFRPAGQAEPQVTAVRGVERIHFGWRDEAYYDKPASTYLHRTLCGTVTGARPWGVFVKLNRWREGFIARSALTTSGKSPEDYQVGDDISVRVACVRRRHGWDDLLLQPVGDRRPAGRGRVAGHPSWRLGEVYKTEPAVVLGRIDLKALRRTRSAGSTVPVAPIPTAPLRVAAIGSAG